ncbi:hypothetical protein RJ641_003952 [Dillenia turbinata]|uniref:Uncharacterized protein n=1 Tax=Dillenia turbinata TaxID=194707 RepID=A0AAN8V7L0_9MAGN
MVTKRNSQNSMEAGTPSDRDAPKANSETAAEEEKGMGVPEVNYEHEVGKLLDGLGPRYEDWPGGHPSPVDTDMLPGTIPGRSRHLQGLSVAMIKSWERSSIAKIALKRTTNYN